VGGLVRRQLTALHAFGDAGLLVRLATVP
jgi:hypothetical protein